MSETFNVAEFLRKWAAERPEQAAIRFPAANWSLQAPTWDSWTFPDLDRQSDAFARGFAKNGVRRGDRTLVLVKPSLDLYAVLFGLFKLGAVPVLLDPGMGMKALLACIGRTRPRVVIAISPVHAVRTFYRSPFSAAEVFVTAGRRWFWGGATLDDCRVEGDEPFEIAAMAADDDAAIIFTSGSTGLAKGVASKHGMFRAQVESLTEMFGFQPGWTNAQAFAAFAIFDVCMGLTSALHPMDLSKPATADPARIAATFRTFEPEVAFASPIVWQNLSRWALANDATFPSLKTAITVGAPIPAYLLRRYRKILAPGSVMATPYGATEGLPISFVTSDEVLDETWARTAQGHGTCVGRPAPFAEIRIIGITDDSIPEWSDDLALAQGEIGEVVVGGPQMSPEYKDAPDANVAAKIRDGDRVLHRMGDLGYLDDAGRLWFCGRKAHRLETTRGTVPAVPVEGVYNEHPDVFRTALVGVGERGREIGVLCVEMEPGKAFTAEVEAALRELEEGTRWAGVVARFLPHPGFPTDARHNSKIRREDLRAWAEGRVGDTLLHTRARIGAGGEAA